MTTDLRTAAQQALEFCEFLWHEVVLNDWAEGQREAAEAALRAALVEDAMQKFTDVSQEIEAALAEPPVDDPHRDHWVAIAEAAQKIAASTECGLAEVKALCAALDRLTDAALAEPAQEPAFHGFMSADGTRVDLCFTPSSPRNDGTYATAYYTAPPQRPAEPAQEPQCNPHPKAPHGFLRNASHTNDRYVCECEYWDPYEAGYQSGCEAMLKQEDQEPAALLTTWVSETEAVTEPLFKAPRRLTDAEIGEVWFAARIPGLTETDARRLIRAAEARSGAR